MTNETTASHPCPTCGGSKVDPGGLPVCRTCSASQPKSIEDRLSICPQCEGAGDSHCRICKGSGEIPVWPDRSLKPKSIGDDAKFRELILRWKFADSQEEAEIAYRKVIEYLDSRAPAARASAAIQAAPSLFGFNREELDEVACGYETEPKSIDVGSDGCHVESSSSYVARFIRAALAAAIQEPVMVAEPLDMVLPCDIKIGVMTIRKGCKLRTLVTRAESLHRMLMEHMPPPTPEEVAAFQAVLTGANKEVRAPMVADPAGVELTVWCGAMPESNGKSNFTALLMRKGGDMVDGITLDRSEYPDRVRYEADRVRYLLGELAEPPFILDYDADKHSGYVKPDAATVKALPSEALDAQPAPSRNDVLQEAYIAIKNIQTAWGESPTYDQVMAKLRELTAAPLAPKTDGSK